MRLPRFFIIYKHSHDDDFYDDVTDHYLLVDPMEEKGVVRWAMTDSLGRIDIIFEASELRIYDPWTKKLVYRMNHRADTWENISEGIRSKVIEIWAESIRGGDSGEGEEDNSSTSGGDKERAKTRSG